MHPSINTRSRIKLDLSSEKNAHVVVDILKCAACRSNITLSFSSISIKMRAYMRRVRRRISHAQAKDGSIKCPMPDRQTMLTSPRSSIRNKPPGGRRKRPCANDPSFSWSGLPGACPWQNTTGQPAPVTRSLQLALTYFQYRLSRFTSYTLKYYTISFQLVCTLYMTIVNWFTR